MENTQSSTQAEAANPPQKIDVVRISHPKIFKIIVLGDSNVGKTSLTYRFCDGKFLENVEATIGVDFRSRTLNIDGDEIQLQLWDTAGQERFRTTMVKHYYRNAHAIVLVYDVTNISSFHSIKKWVNECNENCPQEIPRILVGNKCDGAAAVTSNVAQRLADQYNMPLFETSARLDCQCDNVDAIFLTLAHKLKNQKPFLPLQNFKINSITDQQTVTSSSSSSSCC